jgi:hypothetical protein
MPAPADVAATSARVLPDWAGRLAGLVEIPPPADIPGRSPWLIVHRDLRRLPSIRAVHAWIVRAFTK